MTITELYSAHRRSICNRATLASSNDIWCFYCKKQVKYSDIIDWTDRKQSQTLYNSTEPTAICPHCSIDSLIASPEPGVLDALNEYFFSPKKNQKLWFITSFSIIPPEKRKKVYSWWKASRNALRRAFIPSNLLPKVSVNFWKNLKRLWKEFHNWEHLPIDRLTWGFYSSFPKALSTVERNMTDLRETDFQYCCIEGRNEGLYQIVEEKDQIFFKWEGSNETGKWVQLPSVPEEIKIAFGNHQIQLLEM